MDDPHLVLLLSLPRRSIFIEVSSIYSCSVTYNKLPDRHPIHVDNQEVLSYIESVTYYTNLPLR